MVLGAADGQGEALVGAVLSAFDKNRLASMLRFKGGMVLDQEVNTAAPFKQVVEDLVVLLDQNGETDRFVSLALGERGGNPKLQAVAGARGIEAPAAVPPGVVQGTVADFVCAAQKSAPADPALASLAQTLNVPPPTAEPPTPLEALVARRSKLIDFERFQARLAEMDKRVCLIRVPGSAGTGFLVGPDLVLTNYHVVKTMAEGGCTPADVVCEFDFNSTAAQTVRVGLSGAPKALSPYAASDLSGTGDPQDDQLDYALLPLTDRPGDARGFYTLDPLPRLLALNDFLFVCQHAGAQMLQLAMGTITDFPGKALRIRYDVTTEPGSSGSPCFSAELDLVGLHHAADPAATPTYNQAVPLWLIARDAKAKGALA